MDRKHKGFSLVESMVAIAIASIIMGAFMPDILGFVRTYRRDGVVDKIAGDVRKARASAIATGWQYKVIGYNAGASSDYKNQYRIMAKSPAATGWPADTAAPMTSSTQMAGNWINVSTMFPGVNLNPSVTTTFSVIFDSRGVRIAVDPSFAPMTVTSQSGSTKSITVSAVGTVTVQ